MIIALENARHELIDMRDKVKDLGSALRIEALQGRVAELEQKVEELGKKKLAYEIKKFNTGYYFYYEIEANKETIEEFDRVARLNENLLRHLIIRVED